MSDDIPFIEKPDELNNDPEVNGLICFLTPKRPCDTDCMGYTTEPAESPLLNSQQKHCAIIVALERVGRYSGGVVQLIRTAKADFDRAAQSPPQGG